MSARGPWAVLSALALVFVSRAADACPACTTRSSGGYMIPVLLGAMILTPYIVVTVVMRIIRKGEAEQALEDTAVAHRAAVEEA